MTMESARIVLCTCPDQAVADTIAHTLVEARLAACVTRLPGVRSTYRWQGGVESADEVMLLIKTSADRYPALADRLIELHPYQVPEILALPVSAGLPAYLHWLEEETSA